MIGWIKGQKVMIISTANVYHHMDLVTIMIIHPTIRPTATTKSLFNNYVSI
jgi:hypothetical protein